MRVLLAGFVTFRGVLGASLGILLAAGGFGARLAFDQDRLLVGYYTGPPILALGADKAGSTAGGVAYLYRFGGGSWNRIAHFESPLAEPVGVGLEVALAGDLGLVGAPMMDLPPIQDPGAVFQLPLVVFADDFEDGDTGRWSATATAAF